MEDVCPGGRASHLAAVPQVQRDQTTDPAADTAGALREECRHQGQATGAHAQADEQQQPEQRQDSED